MDTALQDDSDYDSRSRSRDSHTRKRRRLSPEDNLDRMSGTPRHSSSPVKDVPKLKWQRLQRQYSDQYLSLFREFVDSQQDENTARKFRTSQIGASIWQADEKARFFNALVGRGRHDLPGIVKAVNTKSQFEVKVYLDLLQNAEIERQLFGKQTKNISQAEYRAAIEIGPETEEKLDAAADALAAFQEQYDFALAQKAADGPWLVDRTVAIGYDQQAKQQEESEEYENGVSNPGTSNSAPTNLFCLGNFLKLTENSFMVGSQSDHTTHWNYLAEADESPAIAHDALAEFTDIVTNLTRRIVQATLFFAESRIRSTTNERYQPLMRVHKQDVYATLDTLGMKHDSWDYWTNFPRRQNVQVVVDSHQRGQNEKKYISHDEAEELLAIRHFRGRRRSLSVSSGISDDQENVSPGSFASHTSGGEEAAKTDIQVPESTDEDEFQSHKSSDSSPQHERVDGVARTQNMTDIESRLLLDERLDAYLEAIDQQASLQEEIRLQQLLGSYEDQQIKIEEEESHRRPKVRRKTVEEVKVWTEEYQAEWESLVEEVPQPSSEA